MWFSVHGAAVICEPDSGSLFCRARHQTRGPQSEQLPTVEQYGPFIEDEQIVLGEFVVPVARRRRGEPDRTIDQRVHALLLDRIFANFAAGSVLLKPFLCRLL